MLSANRLAIVRLLMGEAPDRRAGVATITKSAKITPPVNTQVIPQIRITLPATIAEGVTPTTTRTKEKTMTGVRRGVRLSAISISAANVNHKGPAGRPAGPFSWV
jgi:hypothetical protein